MNTTRLALLLALCHLATGCSASDPVDPEPQNVEVGQGCYSASYAGRPQGQIGCGLLSTLGRADVDTWFAGEIASQREFWRGNPASVYVFDECAGEANALSLPDQYILFGRNVFWERAYATNSYLAPTVVLAHEWGHQVQFNNGWMVRTEPTVRRTELEADAYAGYYSMLKYSWDPDIVRVLFHTLYDIGDYHYNSPDHHGTPDQRLSAGSVGYDTAIYAINNGVQFSYNDLHTVFTLLIDEMLSGTPVTAPPDSEAYRDLVAYLRSTRFDFDDEGYRRVPLDARRRLFPQEGTDIFAGLEAH